jgi:hypothetical protein
MKEWIIKHHPELSNIEKSEAAILAMSRAIIKAWKAMSQEYLDKLIECMFKRVTALKKAKGWHTKY